MTVFNPTLYKILVVDDIYDNLQILGSSLKLEGYNVEFSTSGDKALEWLKDEKFDLILLDIMMPGISGIETCKILKADSNYKNIPVIFLTARTDKESIVEGFRAGAQDYLTKPFEISELLARVKTHIQLKESREFLEKSNEILEEKVRDRTKQLIEANLKLEKANDELLNLDNLKVEFLNIISHEIRTPLNGIKGFTELIKSNLKEPKLANYIRILDESVARLEKFAITALYITEIKTGTFTLQKRSFRLNEIFKHVVQKLEYISNNKHITIIQPQIDDAIIFRGEEKLIHQAIYHIIENAVIHSPVGTTVAITVENSDKDLTIGVCDEGTGFSEKAFQSLYKLFAPGKTFVDQNRGLGLYFVKQVTNIHNGEINISNNPSKGATVKIVLPRENENDD